MSTKQNQTEAITITESKRLIQLETTIKEGKQAFTEVWLALKEIRDARLYRSDFDTFEEYCQVKWEFTRQHVNQAIAGAEAVKSLPANLETKVSNSHAAKALAKVPEQDRADVVAKASAAGPVTAKAIEKAAASEKPEPAPVIELDSEGETIPPKALVFWNRRQEVQDLLTAVSRMKSTLQKIHDSGDKLWVHCRVQGAVIDLGNIYTNLATAMPYAVCTVCLGLRPDSCKSCKGVGMISHFAWKTFVPKEVKDMKAKNRAKK